MKAILQNFNPSYQVSVCGKWILAGEHAVLRGGRALVFPLFSRFLKLTFSAEEVEFSIRFNNQNNAELELIIWSVLEKALNNLNLKRSDLKGLLELDSQILFGAGMGASATLCVALTHWLCHLGHLKAEGRYDFARELENLFHGESSGVDVAVTLYQKPLVFSRNDGFEFLENYRKPLLFLSHTGARGVTKDCVSQVKDFLLRQPERALAIDEQMKSCVARFHELLLSTKEQTSDWIQTMQQGHECFHQWGLVNESVTRHERQLRAAGAQAVKLTGSGGGGFMLSYWLQDPPKNLPFELIPCFAEPNEILKGN